MGRESRRKRENRMQSQAPTGARASLARVKQATVAKILSLDVVFIVRSYLFKVENGIKTVQAEQRLTRTR